MPQLAAIFALSGPDTAIALATGGFFALVALALACLGLYIGRDRDE
jgi:hypothetical protein